MGHEEGTGSGLEKIGYPELEEVIRRVRGVVSARVLRGDEGEISEVHVVSEPGRNPKQLVRDIESAVLVGLGLSLDHKKISVVQLETEPRGEAFSPASGLPYPAIIGVVYRLKGRQAQVEVELDIGGAQHTGVMSGDYFPGCVGLLAAGAVLKAVEAYTQQKGVFRPVDAVKVSIGRHDAWVVAVEGGAGLQVGAALVVRDEVEAAAEAALVAVCRKPKTVT